MAGKTNQLRCAECGSSDIVLEGQGVWNDEEQSWIIPEPDLEEINGVCYPIDETSLFFCRSCHDAVGCLAS